MRNLTTQFFSFLPPSLSPVFPQLPPLERGSLAVTAVCSNASLAVPLRSQKQRAKLHLPLRSALTRTLLSLKCKKSTLEMHKATLKQKAGPASCLKLPPRKSPGCVSGEEAAQLSGCSTRGSWQGEVTSPVPARDLTACSLE